MLVYDITNEKSFENIRNWVRNIEEVISMFPHWMLKVVFLPLKVAGASLLQMRWASFEFEGNQME